MERSERLFELLGEIDPDLIAAVKISPPAKRPAMWKKWLPAVACLCLCAVIGIAAMQIQMPSKSTKDDILSSSTPTSTKYPPAEDVAAAAEDANKSSEMAGALFPRTTAARFDSFPVGDTVYSCELTSKKLSPVMIEDCLGTAVAKATGTSSDATHPITYYRLLGVSPDCAVGAVFDGEQDIYVYRNEKYRPETLRQLLIDTRMEEYLTVSDTTVTRVEGEYLYTTVYGANLSLIMDSLLTPMLDTAPVSIHHNGNGTTPAIMPELINISCSMEMFGKKNADIRISRNNYLMLSLFGSNYIFPISDEQQKQFLAALAQYDTAPEETVEDLPRGYNHYHDSIGGSYRSGANRFPDITIGDIAYVCGTTTYGIDAVYVGELLGEAPAGSTVIAPTVTYYRLKGVDPECGIAIRFPDDPTYYSYHNFHYKPETLGDLIDGLDLDTYLRIGDPTVTYREAAVTQTAVFHGTDAAILRQTLLSDTEAECIAASDQKEPKGEIRLTIPLRLPLFCGTAEFHLWVTEDGCLHTDLFETFYDDKLYTFRLTEDRTMQYITELLLRYPDFALSVTDTSAVTPPADRKWEKLTPNLKYTSFALDGRTYITAQETVDASALGEQVGEGHAILSDASDGMIYRTPILCRTVKGSPTRQVLAVQFTAQSDASWYLYRNPNYAGGTLQDFMETYQIRHTGTLTDFRSTVLGDDMGSSTIERTGYGNDPLDILFPSADPEYAWEMLFGNPEAPRTPTTRHSQFSRNHHSTMEFTLICPGLGDGEIDVILDKYGYLGFVTKDYETVEVYEIGAERAAAFLEYILTDCIKDHEIRDGAIVIRDGETRLGVITDQLTKRFQPKDTAS